MSYRIDDLLEKADHAEPSHALVFAQMATVLAIREQTEQLARIAAATEPSAIELTQPTAGVADPVSAVRDILGMPTARPLLTTTVPSDEASALGDGDWVPTPEELC